MGDRTFLVRRVPRDRARRGASHRALVAILLAGAVLTSALAAQPARPATPPARWLVRESATVDLWYHGLATIGYDGPGPLPYHVVGYARGMRRVKAARGLEPTPLERDAAPLRAALARDSAFEVLHFLPLYFATTEPAVFLRILRSVADGSPIGPLTPGQRAAIEAVREQLGTGAERAALGLLARDLDSEWREFYAGWATRSAAARREALDALQRRWDESFAPALAVPLAALALRRGTIYVVPALGPEGRVVADAPAGGVPVIAVSWALDDRADPAPLLAAVRELCFPIVRRLPSAVAASADRVAAAGESARAAVRCGAALLDATAPALAAAYRETFRRAAGGAGSHRTFDEAYPLARTTERALAAELRRLLASPGTAAP